MNVKLISKAAGGNGNEKGRKILHHHIVQKPVAFHNVSKPSPVLSDRTEFPSLNESSGKSSDNSNFTGKILKYSDKLKSNTLSNNQDIVLNDIHSKKGAVVINAANQLDEKIHNTKSLNNLSPSDKKGSYNKREKNQNVSQVNSDKRNYGSVNKVDVNPVKNIPKKLLSQSPKENNFQNQHLAHVNKKDLSKQKCPESVSTKSINVNLTSKSSHQIKSKSVKLANEKNESKEDDNAGGGQCNATEKKKKKRKSKVKRQVALQSGKITILTPEVHSKIFSQRNAHTLTVSHSSKSVLTDINDEEEYPELGKALSRTSQKGNYSKKDNLTETSKETIDKPPETFSEDKLLVTGDTKDSPTASVPVKPVSEKKGKTDTKATVHPNDPITISFHDILLNKIISKPKVSDLKDESEIKDPSTIALAKIKTKKDISRPHNLLDSSSPMVKRGKEREKPKPKKPSQLKKIILLDRKARREHLLNLKHSNNVENHAVMDSELMNKSNAIEFEEELEIDTIETNFHTESNSSNESGEVSDDMHLVVTGNSPIESTSHLSDTADQAPLIPSENEDSLEDEFLLEMEQLNFSETYKNSTVLADLSSTNALNEDVKVKGHVNNSDVPLDNVYQSEKESGYVSSKVAETVSALNVPRSPDSLLSSLTNNAKKSEISDKERAAKILLHTRNFREYCNHLISKDIDDAVFSLLDDLARFQDRLHQKDPVKARMKRRLIYGIKEVKKYIKLRKLKCIIIAVDIENVETQGGLNDILNEIKVSAADHHIPCVFALGRKILGKVCRKPVPVSCVGVLNFEGSEVNYKKMVELQTQSKVDYNEIFSKLTLKLTDEEALTLLKAKTEAPETLRVIRTDILNDFFMKSRTDSTDNNNIKSEHMTDMIDSET